MSSTLHASRPGLSIRPVRPHDAPLLGAFFSALSPHSRRRRFHIGIHEVPASWLERFTHPDACDELALLAVADAAGAEVCVGEARYALVEGEPRRREFALAVADAWQGQGVGRGLLERLTRGADERGVGGLFGDVLRDNLPMLGLAQDLGYRLQRHPSDPTLLRVAMDLDDAQRGPRPRLSVPIPCRERARNRAPNFS
jgi:acetyltransferase